MSFQKVMNTVSGPRIKVLISGSGIAGPCLAYWLTKTRLDASITVIERSSQPRITGQAIDIRGPAIEIIKAMRLDEAVRSRTTTEEATHFLNSSGKVCAKFDVGDQFTAEYEILRADLAGLFLEKTAKLKSVKYVYGTSIDSIEQTETKVSVTFSEGSHDEFDVVVAADGSGSTTRPLILNDQDLKDSYKFIGQYIAFFSIPREPTDSKTWQWYSAPKGLAIMTRPHRQTSTIGAYLCITTPARGQRDQVIEDAMNQGTETSKRVLRDYFEHAGWKAERVLKGMDSANDFYMSKAAQIKLPRWVNGRALVLGDAAFATFGIGTSLAIESAYILAGELSKIHSSQDIPQALKSYEAVFRPIISSMGDIPAGFPQLAFPQTDLGLGVRNAALWFVSKTKLYKILGLGSDDNWKLPTYNWLDI